MKFYEIPILGLGLIFTFAAMVAACLFPIYCIYFGGVRYNFRRLRLDPTSRPSWLTLLIYCAFMALWLRVMIPNVLEFDAKAKTSEAKANLKAIYQAQKTYFQQNHTYAGSKAADGEDVGCFQMIHWQPEGQSRYAYFCGETVIVNQLPLGINPLPSLDYWSYPVRPASSAGVFTAMAIGNIDSDGYFDIWMINDQNQLLWLQNDIKNDNLFSILADSQDLKNPALVEKLENWEGSKLEMIYLLSGFIILIPLFCFIIRDHRRYLRAREQAAYGPPPIERFPPPSGR